MSDIEGADGRIMFISKSVTRPEMLRELVLYFPPSIMYVNTAPMNKIKNKIKYILFIYDLAL